MGVQAEGQRWGRGRWAPEYTASEPGMEEAVHDPVEGGGTGGASGLRQETQVTGSQTSL
jgi:hypothetical protein